MALINCPECNREISDKAKACPHCGYPINLNTGYSIYIIGYRDTDTAVSAGLKEVLDIDLDYENVIKILNSLPYKICECNTQEEAEILAKKLDRWWIDIEVTNSNNEPININKNITLCPKCGSTNIQIVPRKWSLLTGIFTNKTDRVCVNCKHKF
ncbi:MAG: zinc ribbon domain-containing protein [Alphaproteobacteria bacterium]|nr:zinc ribbon domain-containing protein [Alphaproteobacteria bacterium]MBQ6886303.1 zinc ribbon domain-containing protein [Lachnospiraceae bacterium]